MSRDPDAGDGEETDLPPPPSSPNYSWWIRIPLALLVYFMFTLVSASLFGLLRVVEWHMDPFSPSYYETGPTYPALAERAKRAGLRTGAVVNLVVVVAYCGFISWAAFQAPFWVANVLGQFVRPVSVILGAGGIVVSAIGLWKIARAFVEAAAYGTGFESTVYRLFRGRTRRCQA
jgi:uncharacterized membrane protein (DUF485 family)